MMPAQAEEILRTLRSGALTFDEVCTRVRSFGSTWTVDQIRLLLLCAPGVQHDAEAGTYRVAHCGTEGELQDAIVDAVRSFAGNLVPAAQVRARLPGHFVTTDEQVLALARRTSALEVFGPKLIRLAQ